MIKIISERPKTRPYFLYGKCENCEHVIATDEGTHYCGGSYIRCPLCNMTVDLLSKELTLDLETLKCIERFENEQK